MSKYWPLNNTPLLSRSMESDSRPRRRRRAMVVEREKLADKYRRGYNTHQWPMDMPRRVQRRIVRQALINQYRPRPEGPGQQKGLTEYQREQQVERRARIRARFK